MKNDTEYRAALKLQAEQKAGTSRPTAPEAPKMAGTMWRMNAEDYI